MRESEIYNEEFKQQFLDSLEGTTLAPVYVSLFKKSMEVESRLEKDIYDFSTKDIELLFYSIGSGSVKSLSVYLSLTIRYVDYAIKSGQRGSNINIFKNTSFAGLDKYVSYYKHQYLTLEEFNEFMKVIANDYDVAIFRALFEGLGGSKYSELRNLKPEDVYEADGEFFVNLLDEGAYGVVEKRTRKISHELYKDLMRADRQEEYISNNGESFNHNSATEFVISPYIFKPLKKGAYTQSKGQINQQSIYRKKTVIHELTDGKIHNIKTLAISGMLHEANKIYQESGEITGENLINIGLLYKKGSNSLHVTARIKRLKEMLANGMEERYNIKL